VDPLPHSRDEAAFQAAYERYALRVRQYIARRVVAGDVDDVLADVFVVLWRKRATVQWDSTLEWWLLRVAYRCIGGVYRSRTRRAALIEKLSLERRTNAEQQLSSPLVEQALRSLSEKDREVLKLDVWDELSAKEGAFVLGVTKAAYEKRLQRARLRFLEEFNQLSETPHSRTFIDRS
jgi:RNA polymerase sigma-70 factor (ECF subfamily)